MLDVAPSLDKLVQQTRKQFESRYAQTPQWIAAAPGRVNLIGEHTDYNNGFVFPMAIDRYVVMAGGPRESDDKSIRLYSAMMDQSATVKIGKTEQKQCRCLGTICTGRVNSLL